MLDKEPLIIAGMHRSGTSMITNYLSNAGLKLGNSLLDANEHNPYGYFEDKKFVQLQGKILTEACKDGHKGWPDWGYTEDLKFRPSVAEKYTSEAKKIIDEKVKTDLWGWKDPRSTLLLDFWLKLLPNAKVLGIYRNPWEVKQSMQNLKAKVFIDNPHYAYEIWNLYNHHLLEFAKRNPDNTILICSNAFIQNPNKLTELISEKWKYPFEPEQANDFSFYDSKLFSGLKNRKYYDDFIKKPEHVELLEELNRHSDLSGDIALNDSADFTKKISVVIPCYNQGKYIDDAINSLYVSKNKIAEIVIINDGSNDNQTDEILDNLQLENIKIVKQENGGLANARNRGIAETNGEYILFLDSDNKADPKYLTEAFKILESQSDVGAVYSNPRFFGDNSLMRKLDDFDIEKILCQNYIDACTVIRRETLEKCGGYDEKMPVSGYEDWEMWIRLFNNGWQIHHLNEFLFDYRVKNISMVSNSNLPENRELNLAYMCKKHNDVYSKNVNVIFPKLMRSYAEMENLCLEKQEKLNKIKGNKLVNVIMNNKSALKLYHFFAKSN